MTLDQFVTKYTGKYLDWDNHYGCQCVDLMRFYQRDVLGVPASSIPPAGYAKDIFKKFVENKYFRKIYNTPTGIPKKGSIIFWTTYPFLYGIAGHVGIYTAGDVNSVISFDQNYPTNTSCHLQKHSYRACLGWLEPK